MGQDSTRPFTIGKLDLVKCRKTFILKNTNTISEYFEKESLESNLTVSVINAEHKLFLKLSMS